MKRNFSPAAVALFSFRRWRWLGALRRLLRGGSRRATLSRRKATEQTTERRARVEVCALESRESFNDCGMGLLAAASGVIGGVLIKSLVDSFLAQTAATSLGAYFAGTTIAAAANDAGELSDDSLAHLADANAASRGREPSDGALHGEPGGGGGGDSGGSFAGNDARGMLDAAFAGGGMSTNNNDVAQALTDALANQNLPPSAAAPAPAQAGTGIPALSAALSGATQTSFAQLNPTLPLFGSGGAIQATGASPAATAPPVFFASQGPGGQPGQLVAQAPGFDLSLTGQGATFVLNDSSSSAKPDVVQMQFVGASGNAQLAGVDPGPGQIQNFPGITPSQLHVASPTYSGATATNVYQGIDVSFYHNRAGQLEYDWTVNPGSRGGPGQIRMNVQGATQLGLDGQGNLIISTPHGA